MVSSSTSRSRVSHSRSVSKHRHKSAHGHRSETEERRHRRRKSNAVDDYSSHSFVYVTERPRTRSSTIEVSEKRRVDDTSDADEDGVMSAVSEESRSEPEPKLKERKVKYIYVESERPISLRRSSTRVANDSKLSRDDIKVSTTSSHRSNTASGKLKVQSVQDIRESKSVTRSHSLSQSHLPTKSSYEPSWNSKAASKRASFFGIFTPAIIEEKPPRLVECLTCLSDDIPIAKSAKLKCGHRMCHSCLRRIFKLSVNDPQHMPPKCCTSSHIPLKHVDSLFDVTFKKLWNKKFQEYTTKNRIYCPSRRCGEWIKPGSIHSEGGKKFGKCGRCKTKVCCLCNGKWHGNKDCPKDEETNALLETAKQSGWQRCYNCRTMVELKEGCNHMTCRCRAEFCMICGLKWKSCNCPWFNYEQVENDRLEHMRVAGENIGEDDRNFDMQIPARAGDLGRPPRPRIYRDEIRLRRRQELLDEDFARRLHILGIDDDDDYNGRVGNLDGIGNARGHFMDEDFRRPATADTQIRQRVAQDNPAPARRNAEIPVLRRAGVDYAGDAARHAPESVVGSRRARPPRPVPAPATEARPSVLAGLGGAGRGSGRVGAWRTHVEPGVVPVEGVLSM